MIVVVNVADSSDQPVQLGNIICQYYMLHCTVHDALIYIQLGSLVYCTVIIKLYMHVHLSQSW